MTAFGGFPPKTIRFPRELGVNNNNNNNNKDWFDAHRADYEAYWVAAAKALVVAAGQQLAELAPGIRAEPGVLGSIFRINRDTRFARVGAGCHGFDPERLSRFREAVADLSTGAELAGIAQRLEVAGYQLGGAALKRPPRGLRRRPGRTLPAP
jgi:uncharacterized protein (DUF2461 family)